MWEILAIGCIGYVVMVDSTCPAYIGEAANVIRFFTNMLDQFYPGTFSEKASQVKYIRLRPLSVSTLVALIAVRDSSVRKLDQ